MKIDGMVVGLAFVCTAGVSTGAFADGFHLSQVHLDAGSGIVAGDVNGEPGFIAKQGQPFELHIRAEVGWFAAPPEGGALAQKSSDIKDPEYDLLWPESSDYPTTRLPGGMTFDSETGVLSGTPDESGTFSYVPAIRDKKDGESPYRGTGTWQTDFVTSDGKTWIESKNEAPIVIMPETMPKGVMLQCTGSPAGDLLIQVFYDGGFAEIIGNDGNIAGVYRATVTDDYIAWGKTNIAKPAFRASSVRLDRRTGAFTTTSDNGNGVTGSCQKRAAEQKF